MTNLEFHKKEINDKFSATYENMGTILEEIYQKYTGQLELDVKFVDLIDWLCEEHKEPILTEKEKEYLSAVIRPFRKRITFIIKRPYSDSRRYLIIYDLEDSNETYMSFPTFEEGTMYKGMEVDKKYTLEELGL